MAEKQLLQTRLKSINSLLDNNAKQLELTRSKIVSILTPLNYQQCQKFIDKIKEKRFIKVRERQVRKLNNGSIPFLDTIVKPEVDCSLSITVNRKPTHTDQYQQWDSHHNPSAKFSVMNTLSHRAQTVCSNPELLKKEKEHLMKALIKCK